MGLGHVPSATTEPPTRPQMGGLARAPHAGDAPPVTNPQMYSAPAPGHIRAPAPALTPGRFADRVRELRESGWELATEGLGGATAPPGTPPAELAEAVLECVHASGVDLLSMPPKHRCLVLRAGEGAWTVGRQQQPNFVSRLVPDEALRTVISRSHVLFTAEMSALRLKKLSPNSVLVNGQPIQQQEVVLTPGARIGFCGQDNATAFLTFAVLLREGGAAPAARSPQAAPGPDAQHTSESMQSPARTPPATAPTWWFSGPPTPYMLVCVLAWGYDIATQPLQARTVGLPAEGRLNFGRIHQPGFFEGVLGVEAAQRYLCCVSRTHLEVAAAAGAPPGSFDVTNLSANPVALAGQRRLAKGDRGMVRVGETIDFIGGSAGGSGSPVVYLQLRLDSRQPAAVQSQAEQRAPQPSPLQAPQVPPTQAHASVPESPAPPSPARCPGASASAQLLPAAEEVAARSPRTQSAPPFWLELRGSAVKRDFPRGRRHLEGREDGLTVGRACQQALHAEAFEVELRQYLSREHFRIERSRDGSCRLVPMSSNPVWRVRRGRSTEAILGDPAMTLEHGDAIQLFTGAEDCTTDGPGNLGTLLWVFQDPAVLADEGESPPTPRRAGRGGRTPEPGGSTSPRLLDGGGARRPPGSPARNRSTSARRLFDRGPAEAPGGRARGGSGRREATPRAGALKAPVAGLRSEEDDSLLGRLGADHLYRDVDDKFTASGFRC